MELAIVEKREHRTTVPQYFADLWENSECVSKNASQAFYFEYFI